jgi:hypothetical protein
LFLATTTAGNADVRNNLSISFADKKTPMKNVFLLLAGCLLTLNSICQEYKTGTAVEIKWNNTWYKGSVLEIKDEKYKVHYDGWSSSWNEWVGKDRLRILGVKNTATTTAAVTAKENNTTAGLQTFAAATRKAGKWEATVSNGYKGDRLTFTVSPDGKRVDSVAFTGYWQKKNRMSIEVLKNLDPPDAFVVANGIFSAVQQMPKAGMWWEMTGQFVTPTTAQGTYRATFAGGENDTYKLQWTAKRVGQ